MFALLAPFAAGLVFGTGLIISGMTDPAIVLGFLDIAGAWNPALMFVMLGAIPVTWLGFRLAKGCRTPWCGGSFNWPTATQFDASLILGSILFGIGWGLAGICPGPALVNVTAFGHGIVVFTAAMLGGMVLAKIIIKKA